jgi:hypothetical protein
MCATCFGHPQTGEKVSVTWGPLIGFFSSLNPSMTPSATAVPPRSASTRIVAA